MAVNGSLVGVQRLTLGTSVSCLGRLQLSLHRSGGSNHGVQVAVCRGFRCRTSKLLAMPPFGGGDSHSAGQGVEPV